MTYRFVFRCHFCGCEPDGETHASLSEQQRLLLHGTYLDAEPGNWLVWHGRGVYGPVMYACGEHRDRLKRYLRYHYGGWHVHAKGPHPAGWYLREESDRTRRRKRMYGTRRTFGLG